MFSWFNQFYSLKSKKIPAGRLALRDWVMVIVGWVPGGNFCLIWDQEAGWWVIRGCFEQQLQVTMAPCLCSLVQDSISPSFSLGIHICSLVSRKILKVILLAKQKWDTIIYNHFWIPLLFQFHSKVTFPLLLLQSHPPNFRWSEVFSWSTIGPGTWWQDITSRETKMLSHCRGK